MRSHYDSLCLMILNSMFGKKRNLSFCFYHSQVLSEKNLEIEDEKKKKKK